MAQKKKEQEDVHLENVQEALSKSEAFIEQYRKQLVICVAVVVAVVVAVILFNTYYLVPRAQEAKEALLPAVAAFENDQYELALRGDESFDGFAAIVDDYGMTDAGELATYYAGVCADQRSIWLRLPACCKAMRIAIWKSTKRLQNVSKRLQIAKAPW